MGNSKTPKHFDLGVLRPHSVFPETELIELLESFSSRIFSPILPLFQHSIVPIVLIPDVLQEPLVGSLFQHRVLLPAHRPGQQQHEIALLKVSPLGVCDILGGNPSFLPSRISFRVMTLSSETRLTVPLENLWVSLMF